MPEKVNCYGWDGSGWVEMLVNSDGKLIIDPTEILEDDPTDNEHGKAPTSDWAYEHKNDEDAHHTRYTDAKAIAAAKTDAELLNYTEGARVYNDASQDVADSTLVTLAFNSERWDTDTIHNNITNNSRLTCKTAGKYMIVGNIIFETSNAAGIRILRIYLNGTTCIAEARQGGTGLSDFLVVTSIYDLDINDYVTLVAWQNTGDTVPITYTAESTPEFMMQKIG